MEDGKCSAMTKKGTPCTRNAKVNGFCNQHVPSADGDVKTKTSAKKSSGPKQAHVDPIYTLTFADVVYNDAGNGNEKLGTADEAGFDIEELTNAQAMFENLGADCEFFDLVDQLPDGAKDEAESAAILVIRGGVSKLLEAAEHNADDLLEEQKNIEYDSKVKMRGKAVNKQGRHNICFGEDATDPDHNEGQGTVIAFDEEMMPVLYAFREALPELIGENAEGLNCEGNLYYDPNKCGIGFHGDSDRRKVIAARLGGGTASMALDFMWFQQTKSIGERLHIDLYHGDMYIMSEKAVGTDSKKRKILTIRHAAGADKHLIVKNE